jgi:hypothetical protein
MRVIQSGHIGDLIYSLTATKKASELHGEKIDFHIGFREQNSVPGHPGGGYCMNLNSYEYVKPLLEHQEYINAVHMHHHQDVVYDFDKFRRHGLNLGAGDLRRNQFLVYPELITDLHNPCITASEPIPSFKDYILLNFSSRYRNHDINYFPLKEHKCIFFGYESEYIAFTERWQLDCELLKCADALMLATIMGSVKAFIGNQSSTYAIAEQMKVKRLLEVCPNTPNVIPVNNGFDYVTNQAFNYLLKNL